MKNKKKKLNEINNLSILLDNITEEYDVLRNDIINIDEENEKIRKRDVSHFLSNADEMIKESEKLKIERDKRKTEMIDFILKKTKKYGNFNILSEQTNDKLGEYIYQIKNRKSFIRKLFNI